MKFHGKDYDPTITRQIQYEEGKGLVLKTLFSDYKKSVDICIDAVAADKAVAKAVAKLTNEEGIINGQTTLVYQDLRR